MRDDNKKYRDHQDTPQEIIVNPHKFAMHLIRPDASKTEAREAEDEVWGGP